MAGNTFHSFSGVDMHAVFGDVEFGTVQMVSYNINRQKAPVHVMGSSDPRTIARGKRTITGAVVFVVFERDSLLEVMRDRTDQPYLSNQESANYNAEGVSIAPAGGSNSIGNLASGTNTNVVGNNVNGTDLVTRTNARLADQLLPFDITLVGANEYGKTTRMIINDVDLMTEAGGVSIDDFVLEKQMSFLARSIQNWDNQSAVVSGNTSA